MLDQKSLAKFQETLGAFGIDELFDPEVPAIVYVPESNARIKAERIYILSEKLQAYARRLMGQDAAPSGFAPPRTADNGGARPRPKPSDPRAHPLARDPEDEPDDEPLEDPDPDAEPDADPEDEEDPEPAEMADTRDVVLAEDGFPPTRSSEGREFLDSRRARQASTQRAVPATAGRRIVGAPTTMPAPLERPETSDDSRKRVARFPPSARARPVNPARLAPLATEKR